MNQEDIFRLPKKDKTPLTFVERLGKRLKTKSEVLEIKKAKKKKGGFFGLWIKKDSQQFSIHLW